ncbi:cysteine desulfurase DndA [Klebsiella pneumoniae]|uniref:cysteine desulfurase DndA n=1 Tax=Klebsiella pneumoniae TaxID=573 RepID=UPI001005A4D8|nr:cysteine desulfurase DndA [Klebsiella pneumoniae]MDX7193281.1 cysteine desulfurase DndA [Klebsiella pneumoniae]VAX92653.1 Cysteine desulfurase [Klebsiella pneumoniae]
MSVYLDCNATTPVSSSVAQVVTYYINEEFGNAGSRTHEFGLVAKKAVEKARSQVASLADADKSEVIFTSGATESNNIAILGLQAEAQKSGKKHIITTRIEHKAVLEPIEYLASNGFTVTYLDIGESGVLDPAALKNSLRDDTLLVSIMHINNETGSIQPIKNLCNVLEHHDAYFHVDAAQGYGKYPEDLVNQRIDMISISGHKLYAPKGIGALIIRRRGFSKVPLIPLMFGGGQEKGLRPGTLPVALIAGLGQACIDAQKNYLIWRSKCEDIKCSMVQVFEALGGQINGSNTASHVMNVSIPYVNSEAAMVALKGLISISNGSACTSQNYTASHVLASMGFTDERIENAIRISWCYMTENIPYDLIYQRIKGLM